MAHREFVCTKDNNIDLRKQGPFLLHIQKAILLSLEEKKLLTKQQRAQCEEALEQRSLTI